MVVFLMSWFYFYMFIHDAFEITDFVKLLCVWIHYLKVSWSINVCKINSRIKSYKSYPQIEYILETKSNMFESNHRYKN